MLKAIGYWIQDLEDDIRPAPQELVGVLARKQRITVANYLDAGKVNTHWLGYSWCRFGCNIKPQDMGSHDLTDGIWLWPKGLAHYVRHHGVVLPPEFLHQALTTVTQQKPRWRKNDLEYARSDDEPIETIDDQYWIDWCALQRSAKTLERLRVIREAAFTRAMAELDTQYKAAIAKLIQERGLTENHCIQKNCRNNALGGQYLCAEHSVDGMLGGVSTRPALYEFLSELSLSHGFTANFEPRKPSYSSKLRTGLRRLVLGKHRSPFKAFKARR